MIFKRYTYLCKYGINCKMKVMVHVTRFTPFLHLKVSILRPFFHVSTHTSFPCKAQEKKLH
jgi:hypothetical protein